MEGEVVIGRGSEEMIKRTDCSIHVEVFFTIRYFPQAEDYCANPFLALLCWKKR